MNFWNKIEKHFSGGGGVTRLVNGFLGQVMVSLPDLLLQIDFRINMKE